MSDFIGEISNITFEAVIIEEINEAQLQIGVPVTVEYSDHFDCAYTAGEIMGTNKVVYLKNDGRVWLASASDVNIAGKVIGMTTHSAIAGGQILVRRLGKIGLTSWGLISNANYFIAESGAISLNKPSTGFIQSIGIARTSVELEIQLSNIIVRG